MERFEDVFSRILDNNKIAYFPCGGEVVSYNSETKKIDVRPAITRKGIDAPVLKNVPVQFLVGSGWKVDFNLSEGDKVLLIFGSHPIPLWTTDENNEREMMAPELHHAIAFPIGVSGGVTISNAAETTCFQMTDDGTQITGNVFVDGVLTATGVKAGVTPTDVALLTHTHSGVTSGSESTGAPNPGT